LPKIFEQNVCTIRDLVELRRETNNNGGREKESGKKTRGGAQFFLYHKDGKPYRIMFIEKEEKVSSTKARRPRDGIKEIIEAEERSAPEGGKKKLFAAGPLSGDAGMGPTPI